MGNCQAIDTASLVIEQPNGKVERLYWPVSASEVMKTNPGHYVALLISSTTLCTSKDQPNCPNKIHSNNNNNPVRITRIKLLKPTDTLLLGQVYRLISDQEVMKGLWAKKQAKMKRNLSESAQMSNQIKDKATGKSELEDNKEINNERQGSRAIATSNANPKSRTWQPSLQSISEAAS